MLAVVAVVPFSIMAVREVPVAVVVAHRIALPL
jgi:hypothetical protein